ncbi:MAG: glycosyltransferase family 2 protein [Ilumatobacter sp.]|nr:glycosyltransferase family 2 protein [Ilumatobacter sp.]
MTGVLAIVPALDEADTIAEVVRSAAAHVDSVVVIDDGSTDGTADLAREAGASCVSHERNLGVGAAIATGLRHALDLGADAAVQVDGDGQHVASSIPVLLAALHSGADLVVGTRFEQGFEMSFVRRTALRFFSAAVSRHVGHHVSDPTSGFRAFGPKAMEKLAPIFPTAYLADTIEVLYLAAESGLIVRTVPVDMIARSGGRPYAGPTKSVVYAARMLLLTIKHFRLRPR